MMSYINETDFVIENKQLVYPEIITDGLQLYYDAKGKRDTDYHRDTMLDMSGNKNHGKLHNFAYEKHSGYKDGLVFDYIDDKLVRPALNLQPNDFTFMLNGNIISFSPDGTVKRVQDGEVIESKGFNMLYKLEEGSQYGLDVKYSYNKAQAKWLPDITTNTFLYSTSKYIFEDGHKYYISYNAKPDGPVNLRIYANQRYLDDDITDPVLNEYNFRSGIIEAESRYSNIFNVRLSFNINNAVSDTVVTVKDVTMIDLTETFGAGNEPSKEQMDEIINQFGFIPNSRDLIDRIEYKGNDLGDMENIIDGLYKTEILSGEEIYTDKADDAVVHVEIDGKSYQNELGHRLDFPDLTGKYLAATSLGAFVFKTLLGASGYYEVDVRATNDESVGNEVFWQWNSTAQSERISLTRNWQRLKSNYFDGNRAIGFRVNVAGTELEISNQLVLDYNIPPSPEYPIEIHSLNDFDVVSQKSEGGVIDGTKVGGRNYVLNSDFIEEQNHWVLQHDKNALFSDSTVILSSDNESPKENDSVYQTLKIERDVNVTASVLVKGEGVLRLRFGAGDVYGKNFTINSPDEFIKVYANFPHTGNQNFMLMLVGKGELIITNVKLERGNVVTEWTPAPEDIAENSNHPLIDKINILLDEPLRSVGNVKDRLFRDSDGIWKIERNVGEYTTDGTDSWSTGVSSGGWNESGKTRSFYSSTLLNKMKSARTINAMTDRFTVGKSTAGIVGSDSEGFSLGYASWGVIFRIEKSRLSTDNSEGFKEWIENNPVTIVYELANPSIETLSQSLQDKLNNLRSSQDSNYVYTVLPNENKYLSKNLKPTLHAKFLYNNWYKEDRVINNLMIYNRALTNEEMLQNYKTIKRRWGM